MNITEFVKKTNDGKDYTLRPRIICNDGFAMSVQASNGAYCTPRKSNLQRYESLEIGFPSEPEELISCYAEDSSDYKETVYPYTPAKLIDGVIVKHGGINKAKTFA